MSLEIEVHTGKQSIWCIDCYYKKAVKNDDLPKGWQYVWEGGQITNLTRCPQCVAKADNITLHEHSCR